MASYGHNLFVVFLVVWPHSKILLENGQNWKLLKLKVATIENCWNCQNCKLKIVNFPKSKIAKLLNCYFVNLWSWDKLPLFFLILYLWVKLLLYVYNFTLCLKFCSYWFFRHHFVIVSCFCIKCTGNKNELWWRWHFVLDQWWTKQEWRSFLFWWSQKHWRSILPWAKLFELSLWRFWSGPSSQISAR